ncbi:TetR/AcrR family transcriptional regulator [Muribaculaceae bacterium Isolate-110 (HZI)]|nr:TetR/AcrR family transcriptional regulator [Muribaculum intestinale]ROT21185.1 TetR/AcrR family transcriptional regulator [Muribaculaceae bacterium Isolate-110 (HZI)]
MRNKQEENPHIDTEQKIILAAKQEFITKGFAGARTTSIAEAVGVTHAMLHYYFRTKEKLFDRILQDVIATLRQALFTPLEDMSLPFDVMIQNIIERHFDFLADNPDLPRFIISEVYSNQNKATQFTEKLREYAPIFISAMQSKIDYAAEKGICRKVDAGMLLIDIASLNLFTFMASPIIKTAFAGYYESFEQLLACRKVENYDTIMRKLKP